MNPDAKDDDQQDPEVDTINFVPVTDHLLKLLKFLTANPETKIRAFSTKDRNWLTIGIYNQQLELTMTLPDGGKVAKVLNPKERSIIFDASILNTGNQPQQTEASKDTDKKALSVNLEAALAGMAEDTKVKAVLINRERNKPAIAAKARAFALSLKESARRTRVECPDKKTIIFLGVEPSDPKTGLYNNLVALIRETGIQFGFGAKIPAENLARFTMESILKEAAAALPESAEVINKFREQVMSIKETFFNISVLLTGDKSNNSLMIKFEILK